KAGMSSPLSATIHGISTTGNGELGSESIETFFGGLNYLTDHDDCPRSFNETALKFVNASTRASARGITQIEYLTNGHIVNATKTLFTNAATAIKKLELERARL